MSKVCYRTGRCLWPLKNHGIHYSKVTRLTPEDNPRFEMIALQDYWTSHAATMFCPDALWEKTGC